MSFFFFNLKYYYYDYRIRNNYAQSKKMQILDIPSKNRGLSIKINSYSFSLKNQKITPNYYFKINLNIGLIILLIKVSQIYYNF